MSKTLFFNKSGAGQSELARQIDLTLKISRRLIWTTAYGLGVVALLIGSALSFGIEAAPKAAGSANAANRLQPQTAVTCVDGVQRSGALYRICVPNPWNGDLVVYAHGYVAPQLPLSIPDDQVGGASISQSINQLGYAFATTSYAKNGLAIKEGVADVADLVNLFSSANRRPRRTYIVGVSLGGAVATLAAEKFPQLFQGALPLCGPIGDFRAQINYFGDFRLVFDYFFPGVIPGDPFNIPPQVIANFTTVYIPSILAAITLNPVATSQLLKVTRAPIDPADPTSIATTVISLLFFNVLGSNDATAELGGPAFDNRLRVYSGSDDDVSLNKNIKRYSADRAALTEIATFYQTSGRLSSQVVTLHTTGDPVVPFWHEPRYLAKVLTNGSLSRLFPIGVSRYGHVNLTATELVTAFAVLVLKVSGSNLNLAPALGADASEPDPLQENRPAGFIDRQGMDGLPSLWQRRGTN
jgi:pimeloyl-ACP methyl ester carboxylesterase